MTAVATMASAKYSAGPGAMPTLESWPATTVMTAVTAHSTKTPAPRPPSAWAAAPRRVVCPASSSSQRPLSSSPRSSLVLVSRPQTAPRMIRVMEILKAVNPATVCSCGAGPNRAVIALSDP